MRKKEHPDPITQKLEDKLEKKIKTRDPHEYIHDCIVKFSKIIDTCETKEQLTNAKIIMECIDRAIDFYFPTCIPNIMFIAIFGKLLNIQKMKYANKEKELLK